MLAPPPRWLLFISLVALVSASHPALAAPAIHGVVEARGMASTFQIFGGGAALEGGAADWTLVCGGCAIRIAFTSVDEFVVAQGGAVRVFPPGEYEMRELRGVVLITEEARGRFHVQVHGYGDVSAR